VGKKRISIRTLPSGESVRDHPDGTQELISESKIDRFRRSLRGDIDARQADLEADLMRAIDEKRAQLEAGDAVPDDKRPI
jgi:hypothetical protein